MKRLQSWDFYLFGAGEHRGDSSVERECEEFLGSRRVGVGFGGQLRASMVAELVLLIIKAIKEEYTNSLERIRKLKCEIMLENEKMNVI